MNSTINIFKIISLVSSFLIAQAALTQKLNESQIDELISFHKSITTEIVEDKFPPDIILIDLILKNDSIFAEILDLNSVYLDMLLQSKELICYKMTGLQTNFMALIEVGADNLSFKDKCYKVIFERNPQKFFAVHEPPWSVYFIDRKQNKIIYIGERY